MSHFNEHSLEMAIMELFEQQGYSYVNGESQRRLSSIKKLHRSLVNNWNKSL